MQHEMSVPAPAAGRSTRQAPTVTTTYSAWASGQGTRASSTRSRMNQRDSRKSRPPVSTHRAQNRIWRYSGER